MLLFFESQINSKETHNLKKIIEVVFTLMTSRYVIQPSKIVNINFFTLIPELDIHYSIKLFSLSNQKLS